ncbi:unnamed protein product [Pocillopora meandrina]|uniref:Ribosomal protein S10 n=1 Tax=Pocillopora meandrina TaxID=46732 RepID=A0AAU9VLR7_9CNID|nr:unnamed protein product [Pocillopora meandrina]
MCLPLESGCFPQDPVLWSCKRLSRPCSPPLSQEIDGTPLPTIRIHCSSIQFPEERKQRPLHELKVPIGSHLPGRCLEAYKLKISHLPFYLLHNEAILTKLQVRLVSEEKLTRMQRQKI